MATVYWTGNAEAVAQVSTGSIDTVDGTPANNTYTVTIGGVAVSAVGDTDVSTTATNLRTNLNASTHPYFAAVTWSGSSGDITGTADTAGVPFVAALTVSGAGAGTVTDFSATTASAGPSDWSTGGNWDGGSAPSSSDTIILDKSGEEIVYGLDQSAVTGVTVAIRSDVTLGLRWDEFATSADGATTDATVAEYRQSYLKINAASITIDRQLGPGTTLATARCKVHNTITTAATITVYETATAASESAMPAVRILADDADVDLYVRNAPGGVGVGIEPGETATIGEIHVPATAAATRVFIGSGVTWTSWDQDGGDHVAWAAADTTSIDVRGGTLRTEGDWLVTTVNADGGTIEANHRKTAGNMITTLNSAAGSTVDLRGSDAAGTIAAWNPNGGTLLYGPHITLTAINEPTDAVDIQIT